MMKALSSPLFLLLLVVFCLPLRSAQAQFLIAGKIDHPTENDDLYLNIPVISGFYTEHNLYFPVAADGHFELKLPLDTTKFATLIYKRKFFTLLLHPGKDLLIELHQADTSLHIVGGSDDIVNQVVQAVNIEELPFFFYRPAQYADFSAKRLQAELLDPYFAQRDKKIQQVMAAAIDNADKQRLRGELTAMAYGYVTGARMSGQWRGEADSLAGTLLEQKFLEAAPSGPHFYDYVDQSVRHLETKVGKMIRDGKINATATLPYFDMTLDSATHFIARYSKSQLYLHAALRYLSAGTAEDYAFMLIMRSAVHKELKTLADLSAVFLAHFPESRHIPVINRYHSQLKSLLQQNESNAAIQIIPDMEKVNTLEAILKPLRGQVVYLDVWGTWCGPCKAELPYLPQLKARFKGQPIVYLYFDMDEDDQDANWRDFIKVNGMEGLHLRKSRKDIAPFWKELLAGEADQAQYYPQYFIFDKKGKRVRAKAERPSGQAALYEQIQAVLNMP